MSTTVPTETPVATNSDPHLPKLSPDDPRLALRPAAGRTLKKGPAIALVVALAGTLIVSLVVSLVPASKSNDSKKTEAEPTTTPQAPVVPEAIRNAVDRPGRAAHPPPPTDRLLVVPLPDGGEARAAMGAEPQDGYTAPPPQRRTGGALDARTEQKQRAQGAPILFDSARRGGSAEPQPPPPSSSPASSQAPAARNPGASAIDSDPNLQGRKNAFLDSEANKSTGVLQAPLQHPRSPFEVQAGTIIPAVLITAINSDLPGPVIGQVRENVYDTVSGNHLLIPQGARLLANYDSMVAWGQERVLVCWNRLVFPNGDSIALECMPAADLSGAAGLTDQVNEHWARILEGAAVATLLAATTQTLAGNTQGYQPTVAQTWAHGAAGEINSVGQQVTGRNINIQPTITVRPGFSVNVLVTKDLVLPGAYPGASLARQLPSERQIPAQP